MLPLVAMQSRSEAASADENAQQHPQLDWSRMSLITLAHFGLEIEREKERRRMVERTSASLSKAPEHKYPRWSGAPAPRMWGMYTILETCQFTAESKASGTGGVGPVLVRCVFRALNPILPACANARSRAFRSVALPALPSSGLIAARAASVEDVAGNLHRVSGWGSAISRKRVHFIFSISLQTTSFPSHFYKQQVMCYIYLWDAPAVQGNEASLLIRSISTARSAATPAVTDRNTVESSMSTYIIMKSRDNKFQV